MKDKKVFILEWDVFRKEDSWVYKYLTDQKVPEDNFVFVDATLGDSYDSTSKRGFAESDICAFQSTFMRFAVIDQFADALIEFHKQKATPIKAIYFSALVLGEDILERVEKSLKKSKLKYILKYFEVYSVEFSEDKIYKQTHGVFEARRIVWDNKSKTIIYL